MPGHEGRAAVTGNTISCRLLTPIPANVLQLPQEKEDIDTDVALRLGKALGDGARFWMALQIAYDIWNAEQSFKGTVPPVKQLPEGKRSH